MTCYHLKFISQFRNFIQAGELLDIAQYCSCLLKIKVLALQKVSLTLLTQLLSARQSSIEDHMNDPIDESSFYSKYYLNPRKVTVLIGDSLLFNHSNVFPQIEQILQNLYEYISQLTHLDPTPLLCLERIYRVGDSIKNYAAPLVGMFKHIFKQIDNGYTFDGIKYTFECVGSLVTGVSNNQEAASLLSTQLVPELNALMNKGINEVSSLLFQIYALCLRHLPSFPADVKVEWTHPERDCDFSP